ncbi:expressed protein [Phakopsora pachyrhizi]|uniref:Expressed protein n=1 Tax=Phakopsora pachyrhizi TaxID=170000 RepID=A0AAV0ALJ5_PHAPC|nr:expressed protein [Phakopsora pachyrhizi]
MLSDLNQSIPSDSEICQNMSQSLGIDDHFEYPWQLDSIHSASHIGQKNLWLYSQAIGTVNLARRRLNLTGTEPDEESDLCYKRNYDQNLGDYSGNFQSIPNNISQPQRTALEKISHSHLISLEDSLTVQEPGLDSAHSLDHDFDLERARRTVDELSSLESKSERLGILPELVPSLKFLSDSEVTGAIPPIESSSLRIPCSSCGALKPAKFLARLLPCRHPLCKTCVNALINLSCNDPPPPETVCFLCSSLVIGFDPPTAFTINYPTDKNLIYPSPLLELVSPLWYLSELDCIGDETHFFPNNIGGSSWSSPSRQDVGKSPKYIEEREEPRLILPSNAPHRPLNSQWPVVRVEGIKAWLPTEVEFLPPPEICPLPIHILCTPEDGKTLNYCFIEMRNLEAAHLLVRSRHGTKIGHRPCSVGLTSSAELNYKISATGQSKDVWRAAELLLELCEPQKISSAKSPERPFFHLMSILLHFGNIASPNELSELSDCTEKWTNVLCAAVGRLLQSRSLIPEFMNILTTVINTGIVSQFVDTLELSRFLTGLQHSASVSQIKTPQRVAVLREIYN